MKNKEKKMILVLIIMAILIINIIWLITRVGKEQETVNSNVNAIEENTQVEEFVQTLEDGTKLNTSSSLSKEKEFQGLKIKNIQLTNKENKTELIADIENPTGQDKDAMLVDVILYDKEGKEITTLGGRISPIKAGGSTQFSMSAMIDYANAYDFELKLK